MKIDALKLRLSNFEDVDFSGPVSEEEIAAAEAELGFKLPPEFRSFIAGFGCGGVGPESFLGLGGENHLDVVWMRNKLSEKTSGPPLNLIPIRSDGFGNYDCLDISKPTEHGEFLIVQWVHGSGNDQEPGMLAKSYFDWFNSILDMIESP